MADADKERQEEAAETAAAALLALVLLDWGALAERLQPALAEGAMQAAQEVLEAAQASGATVDVDALLAQVRAEAAAAATRRAAGLVGGEGVEYRVGDEVVQYRIDEVTRAMLRDTVRQALEEDWGVGRLRDAIASSYPFSADRAQAIAQTEMTTAEAAAAYLAAQATGVLRTKYWHTTSDRPCQACLDNELQGAVPVADRFDSGHLHPTAHPRCGCFCTYEAA